MDPRQPLLLAYARTPFGRFGGALRALPAVELGQAAARALLLRAGVAPDEIDSVILGQVYQAGCGMNPARQVAIGIDIPIAVPAMTINQVCGSGLQSVALAAQAIRLGEAELVLAGGIESMSNVPHLLRGLRWGQRFGDSPAVDPLIHDGLRDVFCSCSMARTAQGLANEYSITREAADAFALESQRRYARALETGRFATEIVPVEVAGAKGRASVSADEHPRADATPERLAALAPVEDCTPCITAGNASGLNDGAAMLLVGSAEFARRRGLTPLAALGPVVLRGVEPFRMGIGPAPAIRAILERSGKALGAIDLIEVNEAFAVQLLAVAGELGLDPDRLNVNGGAIAIGHPLGASGARILGTLALELARRDASHGIAAACIGGGMGIAAMIERVAS